MNVSWNYQTCLHISFKQDLTLISVAEWFLKGVAKKLTFGCWTYSGLPVYRRIVWICTGCHNIFYHFIFPFIPKSGIKKNIVLQLFGCQLLYYAGWVCRKGERGDRKQKKDFTWWSLRAQWAGPSTHWSPLFAAPPRTAFWHNGDMYFR